MRNKVLHRQISSLQWKLNRLQAMGVLEVLWRIRQSSQARLEKLGIGLVGEISEPIGKTGSPLVEAFPTVNSQPYVQAAERILNGRYDIFSMRNIELGFPPNWNRDPRTGTIAPQLFGKTLNYRDEAIVGDIKYLWEPNRHLELVTLAQAYYLTSDIRYANAVRTLLESWFEQCPYPYGPNWVSSLEHAVRMVNWSFAWHLLGGETSLLFEHKDGKAFQRRWLNSIYQHCYFIAGHFSRHSSANNHLLGEYMGLFIGAVTWPLWKESPQWRDMAYEGFQIEALRQNSEDGVNQEQGVWYHHEVADMILLCGLVGRANGIDFSHKYWDRLESMLDFIASIMDVAGNVPMFGDSDDAVMVRFNPENEDVYRSLLATGAALFERGDFKQKAGRFDDKSRWLLGNAGEDQYTTLQENSADLPVRYAFPEGGYYLLGSNFESPDEVRIVADAGPLGYLSIAAHGHADALSFTLSVAGHEILVDPGTYAYHTQKQWRDYFRGTAAHNTVRIDELDQSVPGGNFLWLKHAKSRCLHFESLADQDLWEAEHDGYRRLTDPVGHHRSMVYDKSEQIINVTDFIDGQKSHLVELHWHFSEDCDVTVQDSVVIVRNNNVVIRMTMPGAKWLPELISGRENPPLGWISRGFDRKVPAPCVRWAGEISGPTKLNTQITITIS